MFLPFMKRRRCLGVDLEPATVKAAVYRSRELITATVPVPPGGQHEPQALVAALSEAASRSGWRGRKAVTTITGERVVVRYLRLPRMTAAELRAGMTYELENYLPTGAQDMVVDWTILGDSSGPENNQMDVLLAAAPRDQVTQLIDLFRGAGLELAAVDLAPLALCRSLAGEITAATIILDIGEQWSHLVLARPGRPLFSRILAFSYKELTRSGITGSTPLADLTQEIRRSLDFYRSQGGAGFNPECLLLTGEGTAIAGLTDFCQGELGVPALIGRPGLPGRPVEPALAIAAGLALREIGI
ncbi:pilus assembly protein PilM [Moorella naiadis]|uniref:type IV pilus biogenesis protein PilM n=1 Tax=Moorella naiadis (nom. illeg.) TaxID=3093670 RepID=UPI003D9CB263